MIPLVCLVTEMIQILFLAYLPEATITVTEKKVKEVMVLEDETFSKFYRPVEELPASINMVEFDDDFDAIFGPQAPKYALQASLYTSGL